MDEKLLYEELAKDMAIQLNSISDSTFRIGLFNNEAEDGFVFYQTNSQNKYAIDKVDFVPVSMQDFIGQIDPIKTTINQKLQTNLQFAVSYSSKNPNNSAKNVQIAIDKFVQNQLARSFSITIQGRDYNVALGASPYSNGTPPTLLNSEDFVFFDVSIYFVVTTANIGNDSRYTITLTRENEEGQEEEYEYDLDLLTKVNVRGANLIPSQEIGTIETSSISAGSAWTFEGSILDEGPWALELEKYIHSPDNNNKVYRFKKYKKDRLVMDKNVILDNALEQDPNGAPILMSFKFRQNKENVVPNI